MTNRTNRLNRIRNKVTKQENSHLNNKKKSNIKDDVREFISKNNLIPVSKLYESKLDKAIAITQYFKAKGITLTYTNEDEMIDEIIADLFGTIEGVMDPKNDRRTNICNIDFAENFYEINSSHVFSQEKQIEKNAISSITEYYQNKIKNDSKQSSKSITSFFNNCSAYNKNDIKLSSNHFLIINQILSASNRIVITAPPCANKTKIANLICSIWAHNIHRFNQIPIYIDAEKLKNQDLEKYLFEQYDIFECYDDIVDYLTPSNCKIIIDNYHCISNDRAKILENEIKEVNQENCILFTRDMPIHQFQKNIILTHSSSILNKQKKLTHDTNFDTQRIYFEEKIEAKLLKKQAKEKSNFLNEIGKLALNMTLNNKYYCSYSKYPDDLLNDANEYNIIKFHTHKTKKFFSFQNIDLQYYFASRLIGKRIDLKNFIMLSECNTYHSFCTHLLSFKSYFCGESNFIHQVLDSLLDKCNLNPSFTNRRKFISYLSKIDVDAINNDTYETQIFKQLVFTEIFTSDWSDILCDDLKSIFRKLKWHYQKQFKVEYLSQFQDFILDYFDNYSPKKQECLSYFFGLIDIMEWQYDRDFILEYAKNILSILENIKKNPPHCHAHLYGSFINFSKHEMIKLKFLSYNETLDFQNKLNEIIPYLTNFPKYWAQSHVRYLNSDEFLHHNCEQIYEDYQTQLHHENKNMFDWVEICYRLAARHQYSSLCDKEKVKYEINKCLDVIIDQKNKNNSNLELDHRLYEAYTILQIKCIDTTYRFCEKMQKLNVAHWDDNSIDKLIQEALIHEDNNDNDFISLFKLISESKAIPYKYLSTYLKKIEHRIHLLPQSQEQLNFYKELIVSVAKYDTTNCYFLSNMLRFDFKQYKELRSDILITIMLQSYFHDHEIWSELKDYANIKQYQEDVIRIISKKEIIEDKRNLEHIMIVWHRIINRGFSENMTAPIKQFLAIVQKENYELAPEFNLLLQKHFSAEDLRVSNQKKSSDNENNIQINIDKNLFELV